MNRLSIWKLLCSTFKKMAAHTTKRVQIVELFDINRSSVKKGLKNFHGSHVYQKLL